MSKKIEKVRVTFTRHHGAYNKGESAGFLPAQAQNLIKAGIATPFDAEAEARAKDAAAEAASLADENAALRAKVEELEAAAAGQAAKDDGAGAPPPQGKAKKDA